MLGRWWRFWNFKWYMFPFHLALRNNLYKTVSVVFGRKFTSTVSIIEDRCWIDLLQKITGTWVVCDQVTYQRLQFLRYLPIIHILHCKVVYCDCTLGVRVKSKLDVILCASGIGLVFLQVLFTVLNSVMNTTVSQKYLLVQMKS